MIRFRWVLFMVLILGLLFSAASLGTLRGRMESLGAQSPTGPVWFVTGVEFDLLRFEQSVSSYVLGQNNADEVNLRFDILWSRVDTVRFGEVGRKLRAMNVETDDYTTLYEALQFLEERVVNLPNMFDPADRDLVVGILEEIRRFNVPMRDMSLDVLEATSQETKGWRETLLQIAELNSIIGIAMALSVLLLVVVFGLDSVQSRRTLREKESLLAEAQAANVAKSQFISVINHELRTPLSSIKGAISLINGNAVGEVPERFRRMLTLAERNCNHLIQLVSDLLDAEKFRAGKMSYNFEQLALAPFIRQCVAANQSFAETFGVRIEAGKLDENVWIFADEKRLSQVMTNLLSNASKFSNTHGTVVVNVRSDEGTAEISVQDFGRGIPKDSIGKLFERFYQVDSSNERERGGTGLGLSIVKSIVEAHQGTLKVESEVGLGTTFSIRFEQVEAARQPLEAISA
ncbi:GHKL domain-containing protein [Pelagovum pacificum]|uniref:histidine kinase n=1 Tax=Pelagovum pacificum TaxID=2588711 RepID=A0A5C5G8T4_9RHOB|nr:GHKL domain-containing protein [Pelagovum pacificum]